MNEAATGVLELLTKRGQQRGFLVVTEILQELEDVEAPPEAFDEVVEALQGTKVNVREDSQNALEATARARKPKRPKRSATERRDNSTDDGAMPHTTDSIYFLKGKQKVV